MKRISSALLVASSLIISTSIANADQFVRMVSGPSGGSWYPLGAKVMQVMESEIKGISTSNTSGGGISNVLAVDGGDAEIGWTYAHTVANGYTGKGKFKKAHKNVRYFATLYGAAFQVAVRADSKIKSFEDMSRSSKKDYDLYNFADTKLTILSISNALSQPKETTRRRLQKLIDYKLLDKNDDGGIILGENYNQIINANAKKTTQELAKFFRVMKKTWSDDELNDIASGKLDF